MDWKGEGYLQYKEGKRLDGDSETTASSRALRTLCFVSVGTELPGVSLIFTFFRKRRLKQRIIQPNFQAQRFMISVQMSHYLIPR